MEIRLKKGEDINFKIVTIKEYEELVKLAEKQRKLQDARRQALIKYHASLSPEEKKARALKAVNARINKKGK